MINENTKLTPVFRIDGESDIELRDFL